LMIEHSGITFQWLGHDGFKVSHGGKTIYFDPYKLSSQHNKKDADLVMISHNHFDHLSIEDLARVTDSNTRIVAAKECVSKLQGFGDAEVKGVAPREKITVQGIAIESVAAYNTNKAFHPKADGKVGFVVTLNDLRIYHAGDTDVIPEMEGINPDFALVPVSGTYVMTAQEAARSVNEMLKPKQLAIPMHYGTVVGNESDAREFSQLVTACPVKILKQE
jgi:L-ascorbate metabolism protein UlaG (beta-lactamase superfamily)